MTKTRNDLAPAQFAEQIKGQYFDQGYQWWMNYGEKKLGGKLKFIILTRHGNLRITNDSPVYNQDICMDKKDIVHLSKSGEAQMQSLGQLITDLMFEVGEIWTSPSIRAQKSTDALALDTNIRIVKDLNDVYAPGLYKEAYTMANLKQMESDPEAQEKLQQIAQKHKHESGPKLAFRMRNQFDKAINSLDAGRTIIFVSHGDPIACLARNLLGQKVPLKGGELKKGIYPEKGNALVAVIMPQGDIFSVYYIKENDPNNLY